MMVDIISLVLIGFVSGIGSASATVTVDYLHDRAKKHLGERR